MQKRPVFLNLWQLKFPLPAIISILHRISGVALFVLLPWVLWMLQHVLFAHVAYKGYSSGHGSGTWVKPASMLGAVVTPVPMLGAVAHFFLWLWLAAFGYHLLAGLRHLVMDLGWAESLPAARRSAMLVLILAVIFAVWVMI